MSPSRPSATNRMASVLLVAAFVLPSLGVLVARFGLPLPGPAVANAADVSGVTLPRSVGTSSRTPQQLAIMRAFQEESKMPFGASPILGRVAELPPITTASFESTPLVRTSESDPAAVVPVFSLSSVMGSADRSMAVINGKLCRIGDSVIDGWTVTAISRDTGRVTLTPGSGEEIVLSLPPKGLRPR